MDAMKKQASRPQNEPELPELSAAPMQLDRQLEFAKWLAIITMVIDHVGYVFAAHLDYIAWRAVGRLCWPLIAWVVAMRLYVAPERTKGYLKRLLPWAVLAQVPYAFVFSISKAPPEPWYDAFNIFFTIGLGCIIFMLVMAWEKSSIAKRMLIAGGITLITVAAVKVDYGAFGVMSVPVLALLARMDIRYAAIGSGIMAALANSFILMTDGILAKYWMLALAPLPASAIALFCLSHYIPMKRLPRWFFYAFYPVHLIIIVIVVIILYPPPAMVR